MSTPTKTQTVAKTAAKEDAMQTGPAGLPNTKPVGVKPRLSDEERARRKAALLADHERLLEARTTQVCSLLKDMGVASLAGRITAYDDLSTEYIQASLQEVRARLEACEAALKARSVSATSAPKVDLKALAVKLAAQRAGTSAQGQ